MSKRSVHRDYNLLAKALACPSAWAPQRQHLLSPAAGLGTMYVLCHLEEVEFLQQTGQPGCMVFLDFSKASPQPPVGPPVHVQHGLWPECLQVRQHHVAKHFSHSSVQWLAISKLSRALRCSTRQLTALLLFVLGAQPLASHLRRQARLGIVRPISM